MSPFNIWDTTKIYEIEYEKRKDDLKYEKEEVEPIAHGESKDWTCESERPLFKKKRAIKLARLLEVRKSFNEANIEKEPAKGYATLIHPSNKKGKDMISRVLREIRIKALAEEIRSADITI